MILNDPSIELDRPLHHISKKGNRVSYRGAENNLEGDTQKRQRTEKAKREKQKIASEHLNQAKREVADLFKPASSQEVPFGVDPKTVLCIFFKQGSCEEGSKCKFSHDLAVETKEEKRDVYDGTRDNEWEEVERVISGMSVWDEGKSEGEDEDGMSL